MHPVLGLKLSFVPLQPASVGRSMCCVIVNVFLPVHSLSFLCRFGRIALANASAKRIKP